MRPQFRQLRGRPRPHVGTTTLTTPLPHAFALQQNEILRENQFTTWSIRRNNIVGLAVMTIIFPGGFYYLYKNECQLRDRAAKIDRKYL